MFEAKRETYGGPTKTSTWLPRVELLTDTEGGLESLRRVYLRSDCLASLASGMATWPGKLPFAIVLLAHPLLLWHGKDSKGNTLMVYVSECVCPVAVVVCAVENNVYRMVALLRGENRENLYLKNCPCRCFDGLHHFICKCVRQGESFYAPNDISCRGHESGMVCDEDTRLGEVLQGATRFKHCFSCRRSAHR